MKLPDATTHVYSPTGMATLVGKGVGNVVRASRTASGSVKSVFLRVPFSRPVQQAPQSLETALRKAILTESQRTGRSLSEKEIDELATKIFTLLEKVFSGELGIDAIPLATELLYSKNALTEFVMPLLKTAGSFSEARLEMLKQILVENIELQKETSEEETQHG